MVKALVLLGAAAAAVSVAQFCRAAVSEERQRRESRRQEHEDTRWEGEGGGPLLTPAAGAPARELRY